jgi:septum formation inhibitor-activating ATPase MinD
VAGFTLIVTGAPELARQMRLSGRFAEVLEASTTGGLRDLITQGQLAARADKGATAFVFADDTVCDTPEAPLSRLIQKLTATGWKVLVAAATPAASQLVATNPAAGLVDRPFSINGVLAALAALGLPADPVEAGFEHFDLRERAPDPVNPAAPSSDGGWLSPSSGDADGWLAPQAPAPAAPASWGEPAQPTQPAATPAMPAFGAPATTQPAATPAMPAFGAPATTQPAATPAMPAFGAPATTQPDQGTWLQSEGSGWPAATPAGVPALGGALPGAPDSLGQPAARVGTYGAQHQLAAARRGFVIVVTAPKGGTGKSSLSLNLTAYLGLRLRAQGRTVCIIDTNFQQADTGKYLNVYTPNITDVYKDQSSMTRERIRTKMVHKDELGFSALLGPARSREANPQWINARLYNQILPLLKEHYDYILVDTPVAELYHDIHRDFALPNADYILVPITPNLPTLMNADRWLYEICQPTHVDGGAGVDRNKIGIVLNRAKETVGLSFEEIQTELSQWRIVGVIPDTDEWQRANNENALVATRNYRELNDAFAQVLHAATGEASLLEGATAVVAQPDGLLGRLRARFSR